ncbi:hypothetical protein SOASR015_16170 [Pectobacterium carotovorum subsp. carotovorum]|nr:hypothetical protein SOASR015_16170 [Pectobacterium carotovorum subsp. carotovorum]GLX57086.1 hypothetical protein Pcaca02_23950 [Pectobacterium carotovorum subsp. carotovorum]
MSIFSSSVLDTVKANPATEAVQTCVTADQAAPALPFKRSKLMNKMPKAFYNVAQDETGKS